jgi:hypothetical protein
VDVQGRLLLLQQLVHFAAVLAGQAFAALSDAAGCCARHAPDNHTDGNAEKGQWAAGQADERAGSSASRGPACGSNRRLGGGGISVQVRTGSADAEQCYPLESGQLRRRSFAGTADESQEQARIPVGGE